MPQDCATKALLSAKSRVFDALWPCECGVKRLGLAAQMRRQRRGQAVDERLLQHAGMTALNINNGDVVL